MTNKLEELIHAIRKGSASGIIRPERIGVQDVNYPARTELIIIERALRKRIDSKKYRGFLEMLKQGFGAAVENENVYLCPVIPTTKPKSGVGINHPDLNHLCHDGIIVNGSSNIGNLYQYGVFGSPDSGSATYLSRPGVTPTTCGNGEVTLFVDKSRLMDKRSIFIDPETIGGNQLLPGYPIENVGDYYFVLGGIPREAITHVNGTKLDDWVLK